MAKAKADHRKRCDVEQNEGDSIRSERADTERRRIVRSARKQGRAKAKRFLSLRVPQSEGSYGISVQDELSEGELFRACDVGEAKAIMN